MLLLGIDIGTSSIKASVVNPTTRKIVASASFPETESEVIAPNPGWAEQSPDQWWEHVEQAILKCHATETYNPMDIAAIGIAYQMHGLVLVDKDQHVLRNSIIWCDSRAVSIGDAAFENIGEEKCLEHLLNSPGNFTASKLAWVKENEPAVYKRIHKIMLPGDYIAMKMTGESTTTVTALSEGIFWDFKLNRVSKDIMEYFGFDDSMLPEIQPIFTSHGELKESVASRLSLRKGIPVSYKAGDQPNHAFSLNVMKPGDIAATAGTSGVIYGITEELGYDRQSRINSFAHVNYEEERRRIGVLLCINGAGIFNRWIKQIAGLNYTYERLNSAAAKVSIGSEGLSAFSFGNGAERMLGNKLVGASFSNLDFNVHGIAHMARAVQESVAFAFRYGLDIMRENGFHPTVVRASKTNMFLSDVFTQTFAGVSNLSVEFYEGDGSYGAAMGAGIGAGIFADADEAFKGRKPVGREEPENIEQYNAIYEKWKEMLTEQINSSSDRDVLSCSFT